MIFSVKHFLAICEAFFLFLQSIKISGVGYVPIHILSLSLSLLLVLDTYKGTLVSEVFLIFLFLWYGRLNARNAVVFFIINEELWKYF